MFIKTFNNGTTFSEFTIAIKVDSSWFALYKLRSLRLYKTSDGLCRGVPAAVDSVGVNSKE